MLSLKFSPLKMLAGVSLTLLTTQCSLGATAEIRKQFFFFTATLVWGCLPSSVVGVGYGPLPWIS